ncbi:MAG: hypothetical protein ACI9D5_000109 [Candidatus Endobugula sp.]|jgi:hypothetical protein
MSSTDVMVLNVMILDSMIIRLRKMSRHENKKSHVILESVFCLSGIQCFSILIVYRLPDQARHDELGMTTLR